MKYLAAFIALFALNLAVTPLHAASMNMDKTVTAGDISVSAVWSRASAGLKRTAGAYMNIANSGSTADRLIGASSPRAKKTELHLSKMENGIMKMEHQPAIDIAAGKTVHLKPGSFHVMFFKLAEAFEEGDMFPLTLTFEKAGKLTVMVLVGKAGAMGKMNHN